jgi:hypothetical protein
MHIWIIKEKWKKICFYQSKCCFRPFHSNWEMPQPDKERVSHLN